MSEQPEKIVHRNLRLNRTPDRQRFELWQDPTEPNQDSTFIGFIGYEKEEDDDGQQIYVLLHTIVDERFSRQGYARALVTLTMDFLESHSAQFRSRCSYIDDYVRRYPEYLDLYAEPPREDGA